MTKFFNWSQESVEALRGHVAAKMSGSEIAAAMSVQFDFPFTKNMVIGKCHRNDICLERAVKPPKETAAYQAKSRQRDRIFVIKTKMAKPRIVIEKAAPNVAIPVSLRVALVDLRETDCRFPIGNPGEPDFGFCGSYAEVGVPYCAAHQKIAYVPKPADMARRDNKLISYITRL